MEASRLKILKEFVSKHRSDILTSASIMHSLNNKEEFIDSKPKTIDALVKELTYCELKRRYPNREYFYWTEILEVERQTRKELFL